MTAAPALSTVHRFTTEHSPSPALTGAQVHARLDGLLFDVTLTQHYQNTGSEALELQYSFPLPAGATLLGLVVDWNGRRLEGRVLAKPDAELRYEKALEDGDSPVLVRDNGHGFYTAQLGNLLPGEKAALELRFAQPVSPEQGRLRLSVPTTLTPRYGDMHRQGGLPIHVNAPSGTRVSYPFSVVLDIAGVAAHSRVHSPSHPVTLQMTSDGVRTELQGTGTLDRDFVLLLEQLPTLNVALHAPDGDETVVMASFLPPAHGIASAPLRLKLLVDCSGSMNGDSIALARKALESLSQAVSARDSVSLSRFGSRTIHPLPMLANCDAAQLDLLKASIAGIAADLGGTELEGALRQTYTLRDSMGESSDADLLLITDGAVWNIDQIVATAHAAQQRIFAIGVGSAPGESLLRSLAEQTGGACEFVGVNESMEGAVQRHLERLRGPRGTGLTIDWGTTPVWQSRLPAQIFAGDTVHVFAGLSGAAERAPELRWTAGSESFSARAERQATESALVVRLAAGQRCAESEDATEIRSLALRHQLVTPQTHLFLVHERAAAEKAEGMPAFHEVAAMHAAGSHGYGALAGASDMDFEPSMIMMHADRSAAPKFLRMDRLRMAAPPLSAPRSPQCDEAFDACVNPFGNSSESPKQDSLDMPSFRRPQPPSPAKGFAPDLVLFRFSALLAGRALGDAVGALEQAVPAGCLPPLVEAALLRHGPAQRNQQLALLYLALMLHFKGDTPDAASIAEELLRLGMTDPVQAARALLADFRGLTSERWTL